MTNPARARKPAPSPYNQALDLLARTPRSTKELRDKLRRKLPKDADPAEFEAIDAAIDKLTAAGLLSDATFARQYARSKALGAGASRRRIRMELTRKGVHPETADAALTEVFAEEEVDEEGLVEKAARKKLRSLQSLDPLIRDRRLWSYLARRGYDSDDIRRAITTVTGESADLAE